MLSLYVSILLLFSTMTPVAAHAENTTSLNANNITAVEITGDASRLELSTKDTEPFSATTNSIATGWFSRWYSSWFSGSCESGTTMNLVDRTLSISVASTPWLSNSECEVSIRANVPKNTNIGIRQNALLAKLTGDFGAIHISSNAADVSLEGYASGLDVSGNAIKTDVRYERSNQDETIRLNSNALDAYFSFGADTPISYTVNAMASFIDSKRHNTPGAKPSLDIRGAFVRATIR